MPSELCHCPGPQRRGWALEAAERRVFRCVLAVLETEVALTVRLRAGSGSPDAGRAEVGGDAAQHERE